MVIVGNFVAVFALMLWPLAIILMFRFMTLERALIWSILGGYMLLPQVTEFNFPGIPAFNKTSIPNLTALMVIIVMSGRVPQLLPRSTIGRVLVLTLALSPAITALNNQEPVRFGYQMFGDMMLYNPNDLVRPLLPGMRLYDSLSELARQIIVLIPFFLARQYLRSEAAIREILRALVVAGLIYALPMLAEARLSPQLHTWVYGFFQHDFSQAIRFGGFRPFVFMPHGLWVAFFAFMVAMAGIAMAMTAPREKRWLRIATAVALVALIPICKTLGVMFYAVVLIPVLLFLPVRMHLLFGVAVSVLVLAYPLMRGAGLVPTGPLVERVEQFNPERAQSLGFRFDNEDRIIAHVSEKPILGWGGWGRFMPHDPLTGDSRIVVDGLWIITIGQFGWLGYLALFGLLVLPLLSVWWQGRRAQAPPVPLTVSALVLIYATNLIDLLPNATLVPFSLLIGGALLGYAEELRKAAQHREAETRKRVLQNVIIGAPATRKPPLAEMSSKGGILGQASVASGISRDGIKPVQQPQDGRSLL